MTERVKYNVWKNLIVIFVMAFKLPEAGIFAPIVQPNI